MESDRCLAGSSEKLLNSSRGIWRPEHAFGAQAQHEARVGAQKS